MFWIPFFSVLACVYQSVLCSFDSSTHSPPLPRLSFLSCVSANAEQLDAQVVGPLLLFQVLDFITNSVGGGSNVCVRACAVLVLVGESSRHLWAYLNGRMRHESLPSSSTEGRSFAKRPAERRLSVWDHFLKLFIYIFWGRGRGCLIVLLMVWVLNVTSVFLFSLSKGASKGDTIAEWLGRIQLGRKSQFDSHSSLVGLSRELIRQYQDEG